MYSTKSTKAIFLTTRQAAQMLGVHPDTLRRWRRERVGPTHLRVNRTIRYLPDVILDHTGPERT
jgi:predicted site-specific integrase-resolvase